MEIKVEDEGLDKKTLEERMKRVRQYADDLLSSGPVYSGTALGEQNMYMFAYFQAGLAIAHDVLELINGGIIPSMKDYQALERSRRKAEEDTGAGMAFQ